MQLLLVGSQDVPGLDDALRRAGHEPVRRVRPDGPVPEVILGPADALDAGWIVAIESWQGAGGVGVILWGPYPGALERSAVQVRARFPDAPPVSQLLVAIEGPRTVSRVPLTDGEIALDVGVVRVGEVEECLTPREVELVGYLAARPGQIVSREVLLDRVWGFAPDVVTRVVDATVHRLRAKIEVDPATPSHLFSVRGQGYRFVPGAEAAAAPRSNILPALDAFIGRRSTLDALAARFDGGARLVTLRGPGGIGKSRVARQVALEAGEQWPGGTWFCDLSPCRTRRDVIAVVADALGVRLMSGEGEHAGADLGLVLAERGPALVILDNAEHRIDVVGALLLEWTRGAPRLTFLVTSQQSIDVPGEQVVEVPPLTPDEAVALLRSRAVGRGAVAPEGEDAEAIVDLLEGSPLAVELAAGMLDLLGVHEVVARLGRSLGSLHAPGPGRPLRHRSLREAVRYSFELLDADHRRVLLQCSVFRGGFTAAAAEECLSDAGLDGLAILRDLRARSLLTRRHGADLGVLGSVAEFVAEQAGEADVEQARERHRQWAVRQAGARCELGTIASSDAVRWLSAHRADLLEAFDRSVGGSPDDAAILAGALYQVLALHGPVDDALAMLDQVLRTGPASDEIRLRLELARVAVLRLLGRRDAVERAVADGVALSIQRGDRRSEGRFLASLGAVQLGQGDARAAVAILERAVALHRETDDDVYLGMSLGNLASAYWDRGRGTDAAAVHQEGLAHCRRVGHQRLEAFALAACGAFECETGRPEGISRIERALAIHDASGDPLNRSIAMERMAEAWLVDGDRSLEAVEALEQAAALRRSRGEVHPDPVFLHSLGAAQVAAGRLDEAHVCFSMAVADPRVGQAELRTFLDLALRLCARLRGVSELPTADGGEALDADSRAGRLARVLEAARAADAGDPDGARRHLDAAREPTVEGWPCHFADVVPFVRFVERRLTRSGEPPVPS